MFFFSIPWRGHGNWEAFFFPTALDFFYAITQESHHDQQSTFCLCRVDGHQTAVGMAVAMGWNLKTPLFILVDLVVFIKKNCEFSSIDKVDICIIFASVPVSIFVCFIFYIYIFYIYIYLYIYIYHFFVGCCSDVVNISGVFVQRYLVHAQKPGSQTHVFIVFCQRGGF